MNFVTFEEPLYLFTSTLQNFDISLQWFLDSKASQCMSPQKHLFKDYNNLQTPKFLYLGDNTCHQAIGLGIIFLELPLE